MQHSRKSIRLNMLKRFLISIILFLMIGSASIMINSSFSNMKFFSISFLLLFLFCACSPTNTTEKTSADTVEQSVTITPDLTGQWYIENIVFNDSLNVRPEEEVPGSRQYITFENETYSIITNCNSLSGTYSLKGDSIHIGDGAMTELACDNMATEDALRKILPDVATVDVTNDSIVRLNCKNASSYIILRKAKVQVKCHVE